MREGTVNDEELVEVSSQCCDPPCRLMEIQAMSKADLVESLVNAEEELAMAEAELSRLADSGGSG